jgi:hypothetical protein
VPNASRRWSTFRLLSVVGLGVLLWLSLFELPYVPRRVTLDHSWMMALPYLHEHGFRAGIDYVFNYGPLGFLSSSVYDPDILSEKLLWEGAFKLVVVVLAIRWYLALSGTLVRGLYAIALLVFVCNHDYPDSGYLTAVFLLGATLLEGSGRPTSLALGLAVLAVVALIKFTLFLHVSMLVALLALAVSRARGVPHGIVISTAFLVALGVAWVMSGQPLAGMPPFLRYSWSLAAGYDRAMALEAPHAEIVGVALLVLNVGWLAVSTRGAPGWRGVWTAAWAMLTLAIAWKHGFVRSGGFQFFTFAGILPFFVEPSALQRLPAGLRAGLLCGGVALGLGGMLLSSSGESTLSSVARDRLDRVTGNASFLLDPSGWRESSNGALEELRARYDLPLVRDRVGRESVDVFSYEQGVVLLNGLNWTPRPVFQSISAHTPELLRLNADSFKRKTGPRYVLFRLETIDGRLPTFDDSAALIEVIRHYRVILTEGAFLLLERREAALPIEVDKRLVLEDRVGLGEFVDVAEWSREPLLLELDASDNTLGRLRRLLLRPESMHLEVELSDGARHRYPLVRGLAAEGFLLNPWLTTPAAFAAWRSGHEPQSVRAFRVLARHGDWFLEEEIGLRVRTAPALSPQSARRHPMFQPEPERVTSYDAPRISMVGEWIGLVLSPPAAIHYRLSAGHYLVQGRFGLAQELGRVGGTALFEVEAIDESGERRTLFRRALDPTRRRRDLAAQDLSVGLQVAEETRLVLRVEAGRLGSGRAWPYFTEVRIQPCTGEAARSQCATP